MVEQMAGQVRKYIESYGLIQTGDLVVVGLSGGEDSVCLLSVLGELSKDMHFFLEAVHVNHGIRAGQADEDQEFCRRLCAGWGIPFQAVRVDVPQEAARRGQSLEEAARQERYRVLEECRASAGGSSIAVAHHRRDQAETVLWNLSRGAGLRGIAGMEPRSGRVIRPLLDVDKKSIQEYMREKALAWQLDATNEEEGCTRNRLRLRVLPYLETEINKEAVSHICRAASVAGRADRYLRGQAGRWLKRQEKQEKQRGQEDTGKQEQICVSAAALLEEEDILQEYIIRLACEKVSGLTDISARHVAAVQALLADYRGAGAGRQTELAGHIRVRRAYDRLIFEKRPANKNADKNADKKAEESSSHPQDWSVPEPREYPALIRIGGKICELCVFSYDKMQKIPTNQYTKWLDYDKIERPLVFRNRRPGDYFYLAGGGKKTVKAYMIDQKIPAGERGKIAVAACGSHVMWIEGRRLDEQVKVTEDTKVILQIKIHGGEEDGEDSRIDPGSGCGQEDQ